MLHMKVHLRFHFKRYYTISYYTILYYTILYYTWDKRSCHACWKLMLVSKIKQFYYPRSGDSLQSRTLHKKDNYLYFLLLCRACNTA